jgi:hypothetical protein
MQEKDRPNTSPSALSTPGEPRTCYRCGKPEEAERPLRLLPGSTHIVVCPACYQVLWGWKEPKGKQP